MKIKKRNHLKKYYKRHKEDERLRSRHGQVEFLTTIRYIEKYVKPDMKIAEIGAGTGIYTSAIAEKGYLLDAVELMKSNITVLEKSVKQFENVTVKQGNALDLSFMNDESYDITLLMGPMYHLYNTEDKIKALSEALRITKKNGLLYIAYILSDASVLMYGFITNHIHELIEKDLINLETFDTKSTREEIFELVRKEDINGYNSNFNVERLHFIGSDMFTRQMMKEIDKMDDKTFELYLKYHFNICEREDMTGISNHAIDILRKL